MEPQKELAGLTIMVTGAARSLGAAISEYLEKGDATVWRTDITASAGVHRLDVTSRADWEDAVGQVIKTHGRIDGLVNNAAIFFGFRKFWDEADSEFDGMVAVNLKGTWLGTQIVSKAMAGIGVPGSIVNLSSTSGVMATRGFAGYGTTRWAVRGLTKWAAAELAEHRIRVNSVHPHSVAGTGMMAKIAASLGLNDSDLDRRAKASPLGRMATTDDIAGMIAFLLSKRSEFMTGREFVIDGGASLGGAA